MSTAITSFRHQITPDGDFQPEKGRYHLYGGYFCPWAQRTMIVRKLKGLEDAISFTAVRPETGPEGWHFGDGTEGCDPDPIMGAASLRPVYMTAEPNYTGRYTVPMLYDKKTKRIVNNESAEIIRILNSAFNEFCATPAQAALNLYPDSLKDKIEEVNGFVLPAINMGIYKCSMNDSDDGYQAARKDLLAAFEKLDGILAQQRYLAGAQITEADVRAIVTLLRRPLMPFRTETPGVKDFPNLINYVRELYSLPAVNETINFSHTGRALMNYFNAYNVTPGSVDVADYEAPHNRDQVAAL